MSMPDNMLEGDDYVDNGQKFDDQNPDDALPTDPLEGAEVIEQSGNAVILRHDHFVAVVCFGKEKGLNATFSGGTVDGNIADAFRFIGGQFREHSPVFLPGDRIIREYKGSFIVDQEGKVVVVQPESGVRMLAQPGPLAPTGTRMPIAYEDQLRAAIKHADKLADEGSRQRYLNEYLNRNPEGGQPDDQDKKWKI
ncbi:MAG TPA: hypothetical protein VN616_18405 [Puia sp.]|nr:hypothetical protein [Puia sp.]